MCVWRMLDVLWHSWLGDGASLEELTLERFVLFCSFAKVEGVSGAYFPIIFVTPSGLCISDSYKVVGIATLVETSSIYGEALFEMRRDSIVKQRGNGQDFTDHCNVQSMDALAS